MSDFSLIFKRLLEEKKLKQKAFAELLGVSPQTINQWISGKTTPDIDRLPQIAKVLGVTLDYLLGVKDQPIREQEKHVEKSPPNGFVPAEDLLAAEKKINELQSRLIELLEKENAEKAKTIERQKV